VAQPNDAFVTDGFDVSCRTLVMDWNAGTGVVFDGAINVSGSAFTITASTHLNFFSSATINLAANCTVASDKALPVITAAEDFTTSGALIAARLIGAAGKTFTFKNGVNFTLTAYTDTDWDGLAEIHSVNDATFGFVNPASMVFRDIASIEDCNASNAINAADNCFDATGNTNVQVELFWIEDTSGAWADAANWSLTSGGSAEGSVFPTANNDVHFDGAGAGLCTLDALAACRDIDIDEGDTQINANLDMAGFGLGCRNFLYDCANNNANVLDGEITLSGSTFVVTAMQADAILASANLVLEAACTVTSTDDTAIPAIAAAGDITFDTAITVASLTVEPAATMTFEHSVDFTLTAYTAGDWDGDSGDDVVIVSDDASQWGFVNPAAMVVAYINVQDSNATNAIDATDNCTDGTGTTNWTFV
jgi:hypothetical protein